MMVAEALTRQSGSPINGETPTLSHAMPSSSSYCPRDMMLTSGSSHQGGPPSPSSSEHDHDKDMMMGEGLMYHRPDTPGFPVPSSVEMSASKRKDLFNQRKQREFIPDNKKDESYWDRRRRNNEAAKRSREKRRFNDMILEQRVVELTKENHILKAQLTVIKEKYGISGESLINLDHVLSSLPSSDQVLSLTKRTKLLTSTLLQMNGPAPPPVPAPLLPSHHHHHHHHQGPLPRPHLSISPSPQSLLTPPQQSPVAVPTNPTPVPTPVIHEPIPLDGKAQQQAGEQYHHHHPHHHQVFPPEHCGYPPAPYSQPLYVNGHVLMENHLLAYEQSVLNLSRDRSESFGESSSGGSPVDAASSSGDEQPREEVHSPVSVVQGAMSNLPHKLRHKSHLGDKDAASALLALQNIKQEPRTSPVWVDAEDTSGSGTGSSDERDSGISVGECWPQRHLDDAGSPPPRKKARGRRHESGGPPCPTPAVINIDVVQDGEESLESENSHLKSELARLASEVANLKTILTTRKKPAQQPLRTAAEKKETVHA